MATGLKATFKVEVAGASTVTATQKIEAEAYDKIEVTVPGGGKTTVEVQPGGAGQVQLLLITASKYDQTTYEVDQSGTPVDLDAPLLLVGTGALGLLGEVKEIELTNGAGEDVTVQLLVARDATPES